jgi:hypothetical protein
VRDQNLSVVGSSGCVDCTNPNGTVNFSNMTMTGKGYGGGTWYWSFAAHCFYAPYFPQGDFLATVTLRCDSKTGRWVLYVQAQAALSYLQDMPQCPDQQAACYYGWEGNVSVTVDGSGKFRGQVAVPLVFLYGSGEDCCGSSCTITFQFN